MTPTLPGPGRNAFPVPSQSGRSRERHRPWMTALARTARCWSADPTSPGGSARPRPLSDTTWSATS